MSLPTPIAGLSQPATGPLRDRFGRAHSYLRISVTDRCNYRCRYCMPEQGHRWIPREDLLTYEEIERIAAILVRNGVQRIRLTGGEPTVRRGLLDLVSRLAALPGLADLAMTTNGHLFAAHAADYAAAGLRRVNISLDALDPARFAWLTRGGDVGRVLAAVDASIRAGLVPVKLNCVVMRGVNEDDVPSLVERYAGQPDNVVVRFIEYMPFDGVDRTRHHVPVAELHARLARRYTLVPTDDARGGGPSRNVRLRETGQVVGFISPITEHFCEACNRLRLQADGHLRTCLSREAQPSLRDVLRAGATDAEIELALRGRVWSKVAGHEAHLGVRDFEGVMTSVGG